MSANIISIDECTEIVHKLTGNACSKVKVIDFDISSYSDGYPGFLGEYFALKIRFDDVSFCRNEKKFEHLKTISCSFTF